MKKIYYSSVITLLFFTFLLTTESYAQNFNEIDDEPHDISYCRESKTTPPLAKVLYGRPQKNGEKVFGNLVPYNKIWRTGANEATEIKFYKNVKFGDVSVVAGTYVLLTIPGKKEWEIILNSKLDVLGAFQYDPLYDVANIKIPVSNAETLESFSIAFKDNNDVVQMVLAWDNTRIKIPLLFEKKSVLVKI
ncbi:MAG: DUF2911 domain-containing protein [Flavobacteriaceae bacterium]|nr:DUF2911 domain-containing protein [Flavobacteriaceae bacterium]